MNTQALVLNERQYTSHRCPKLMEKLRFKLYLIYNKRIIFYANDFTIVRKTYAEQWYNERLCCSNSYFYWGGGRFVPIKNFSLIWKRYHDWWWATNFDICSALMAIEQWGFFINVPHVLWHGPTLYNGNLRENPWRSQMFWSVLPWSCHYLL